MLWNFAGCARDIVKDIIHVEGGFDSVPRFLSQSLAGFKLQKIRERICLLTYKRVGFF